MNNMKNRLSRYSFLLVTLIVIALLVWVWIVYEDNIEAAQAMTRLTARVSLVIFFFVFSASYLNRLMPSEWSVSLLKNRRGLGLLFAYSHTIHLLCIIAFLWLAHKKPSLSTIIVGGGGYLIIYAMALTSNDWSVKTIGIKYWKRLHIFGIYYLWFIFFLTYLTRLLASAGNVDAASKPGGSALEFVIGMFLVLTMIAFRVIVVFSAKRNLTPVASEGRELL